MFTLEYVRVCIANVQGIITLFSYKPCGMKWLKILFYHFGCGTTVIFKSEWMDTWEKVIEVPSTNGFQSLD